MVLYLAHRILLKAEVTVLFETLILILQPGNLTREWLDTVT